MLKRKIDILFFSVLVCATILFFLYPYPVFLLLILLVLWFIITALGSFNIDWNYHLISLNSNKKIKKKQIAITFDDGPNPEFTPQVLKLLKAHNAKATFFCIGNHIEKYSELFKTIISQEHTVGNHTYSHSRRFGFFSTKKVCLELKNTNTIIKKISGLHCNFYRPAFGVTNPQIKRAVKKLGLQSIGWSNRSFDTTNLPANVILLRIKKRLKNGDVILLHDSSDKTLVVLEQLLLFLHEQNIESVTIDTLFNIEAYA